MTRKRELKPDLPETASPDQVEQAGLDSFPASDPPSWIPVHLGKPATPEPQGSPAKSASRKTDPRADTPAARDTTEQQPAPDTDGAGRVRRSPPR